MTRIGERATEGGPFDAVACRVQAILSITLAAALSGGCADATAGVEDACHDAGGDAALRAERSHGTIAAAVAVFAHFEGEWVLCSGVVAGPRTVLTAAHCVRDRGDWAIDVHFTADLLSGGPSIRVGSRRLHPTQDIAALVLDDQPPIGSEAMPWSGQLLRSPHVPGSSVTGYGAPEGDETKCLRFSVGVQDLSVDPYRSDATRYAVLLDGRAWPGDSGGPFVFQDAAGPVLVGIHSGVTPGDVSNGTLSFIERLGEDDPWVLDATASAPTEIP